MYAAVKSIDCWFFIGFLEHSIQQHFHNSDPAFLEMR